MKVGAKSHAGYASDVFPNFVCKPDREIARVFDRPEAILVVSVDMRAGLDVEHGAEDKGNYIANDF